MMNGLSRAVATLAGAAIAGVLLWLAAHVGRHTTGGYWAAYGIVAGAGLVFALSQVRGRRGNPPAMFAFAFLPVLVTAGWVLVAAEPHGNSFRNHVLTWSTSIGIHDVVTSLTVWLGVLAFGIGYTFGLTLEPAPAPVEPVVVPPTHDHAAADEPLTAERREVVREEPAVREARPVR
jgi:hypothetical protein